MKKYLHVQIVFRQGVVKTYLADQDILMNDFMKVVRAEGKIRTVRWLPDLDQAEADLLVTTGAAVKVEARYEKAEG